MEVLRENHDVRKESTSPDPIVQNVQAASFGSGIQNTNNVFKERRMALRASLEELLEEYLRGFAPESDKTIEVYSRVKKRSVNSESNDSRRNITNSTFCPERRQRITQLDRNELSDAIKKISDNEFNIRKILNHR